MKVMFSQVSVCPRGMSVTHTTWHTHTLLGRHPLAHTPLGRHPLAPPWHTYTPWADTPQHTPAHTPLLAHTPLAPPWADIPQHTQPLGTHSPWTHTPLAHTHTPQLLHVGIRSTSGRYASHWNAFLFLFILMV